MMTPALPLLIATLIASSAGQVFPLVRYRPGEVDAAGFLVEAFGPLALASCLAMGLGLGLTMAVRGAGLPVSEARRRLGRVALLIQGVNLGAYAWLIHGLGWPEFVRSGLGLRGVPVADDLLILAPFLTAETVGWCGLYPAVRAARLAGGGVGLGPYLVARARLGFGMLLPAIVLFWAVTGLARLVLGSTGGGQAQLIGMATLAVALPLISPAFLRLVYPTHSLPPGPVRDRLVRLSRRFDFRVTDILVWETDGTLVTAGISGLLPWYRYVFLSDALLDRLDEHEIAAAFAHEMGHIRHGHFRSLGLFLLGSLGVLALLGQVVEQGISLVGPIGTRRPLVDLARGGLVLGAVGLYYWLVFGRLSRRFEGQADVFGGLAISCGRSDCDRPGRPPHDGYAEVDAGLDAIPDDLQLPTSLCPVGMAIYANMLTTLAESNGIGLEARSWRYESVADRIELLRVLVARPLDERRFQAGVTRLRVALTVTLIGSVALALATGAFDGFRAP